MHDFRRLNLKGREEEDWERQRVLGRELEEMESGLVVDEGRAPQGYVRMPLLIGEPTRYGGRVRMEGESYTKTSIHEQI